MTQHVLKRTSPFGEPFIGTCIKCGKDNIKLEDLSKTECENIVGLDQSEALVALLRAH